MFSCMEAIHSPCRGTQLGQNTCVLLPNNRKKLKKHRFAAIWAFEAILCNKNQNKTIQLDFRQVGSYLVECGNVKCDKHWDVPIFLSKNIKRKEEKSRNSMQKMNFKGRLLLTSRDRNGRQFAFRASQKLYVSKNTETRCE